MRATTDIVNDYLATKPEIMKKIVADAMAYEKRRAFREASRRDYEIAGAMVGKIEGQIAERKKDINRLKGAVLSLQKELKNWRAKLAVARMGCITLGC